MKALLHKISLTFLFLALFCATFSQSKKADRFYALKEYSKAIPLYEKALQKNPADYVIIEKLADCYWNTKNYVEAEKQYKILIEQPAIEEKLALRYAEVLKNNKKLEEAKDAYMIYSTKLLSKADFESFFDEIDQWNTETPKFEISQVQGINTKYSEFSPVPYKNGIVFVSDQKADQVEGSKFGWTNTPYLSVFYAEFDQDSLHFKKPKLFDHAINTDYHNGPIVFDTSYQQAYFTRVNNLKKGASFENKLQLYVSSFKDKKWQQAIPFIYNDVNSSFAHPALSIDGKTLIFVSDMPGGLGGKDLYITQKEGEHWSTPKNLGNTINTDQDEVFPYLDMYNDLYFSSNGHNGYGGLDLFLSPKIKEGWGKPENLRKPINSGADDFGMVYTHENEGYFSSNRTEGEGSDDIYRFLSMEISERTILIKGIFQYSKLEVAKGAKLQLLDENNNVIANVLTDNEGKFEFKKLSADKNYYIRLLEEDNTRLNAESEILLTNKNDEVILAIHPNKKGYFAFKALAREKSNHLMLLPLEDEKLDLSTVFGRVYNKLPGDLPPGLKVFLLDDEGNRIDSSLIDAFGNFSFKKLDQDKNYQLQILDQDPNIQLVMMDEEGNEKLLQRNAQNTFTFQLLSKDKTQIDLKLSDETSSIYISLESSNHTKVVKLALFDRDNHFIQHIQSVSDNKFLVSNIKPYQEYKVVIDSTTEGLKNTSLFILNSTGQKVSQLLKRGKNEFHFYTLHQNDYELLPPLGDENTLHGKAFYKVSGDLTPGTSVYLTDEFGNVIEQTKIDEFGNFSFKKLPKDKSYLIKIESDNSDIQMFLIDENHISQKMELNEDGSYAKTVHPSFSGYVFKKLRGDLPAGLKVYLLNSDQLYLDSTYIDAKGKFTFEKLPADRNFKLSLKYTDTDVLTFIEYTVEGEEIVLDKSKYFLYKTLQRASQKLVLRELNETISPEMDDGSTSKAKLYTIIYYDFNKREFRMQDSSAVDSLIQFLRQNPLVKVKISSHTDSKGEESYNKILSMHRALYIKNYFMRNRVKEARISYEALGELKPVIKDFSADGIEDPEAAKKNRRSEIYIIR